MATFSYETAQMFKKGLSAINWGARLGLIANATVSGANTYAVFRQRVIDNRNAARGEAQMLADKVLRGLEIGNRANVLTDTRLNGLTTLAQVQALFVADTANNDQLPADYDDDLPE